MYLLLGMLTFMLVVMGCHFAYPHFALWHFAGLVPVHVLASPVPGLAPRIAASATSQGSEGITTLIDFGWVPPLVSSLETAESFSRRCAATTLRRVSGFSLETSDALERTGAINSLKFLAVGGDGPSRLEAVAVLRNMAASNARIARKMMVAGVPSLVMFIILEDFDVDLKMQSVGCVSSMLVGNCHLLPKGGFSTLAKIIPIVSSWLPTQDRTWEQWVISGLYAMGTCHPTLKIKVLQFGIEHFVRIDSHSHRYSPMTALIARHAMHEYIDGVI